MGLGKRLGLAATVVALVAGLFTAVPQMPAEADGPATFTHVFGDGDPFDTPADKAAYVVPDDFTFDEGAYVLAITAAVYHADDPTPSDATVTVTGKNLDWELVAEHNFGSVTGSETWVAVYAAWADDPDDGDLYDMKFDFGGQTRILRHVRSFEQSLDIDRTANPVVDVTWNNGPAGTAGVVTLDPFADPDNSSTIFAIFKHRAGSFDSWTAEFTKLNDTRVGAPDPPDPETGDPLRMLTAYAAGEQLEAEAFWTDAAIWHAIGIEISSDAHQEPTTTTTTTEETTTTTSVATTTTTAPATTSTTVVESEPPSDDPFVDDDDSVFEDDIERIAATGITVGCNPPTNDHFCPDDTLTRGQMAAFMARALELTGDPDDKFTDDDDSVFETEIELIAHAGITLGCNPPDNTLFCPEDTLTRGQMAAFIARALELTGDPEDKFIDDDDSVFETEIELIAQAGITLGCNPPVNDLFCPDDTLTRGQMAAFLARMLDHLAA